MQFFIGEPVPVSWNEFTDPIHGGPEEGATIAAKLLTTALTEVPNSTFALTFVESIAGKGAIYRGFSPIMPDIADDANGLVTGGKYILELVATKSSAIIGKRRIPCIAVYQEDV